jgi:hypothetical protein
MLLPCSSAPRNPAASGLQSIVWREKWEATRDEQWKEKLTFAVVLGVACESWSSAARGSSALAWSSGWSPRAELGYAVVVAPGEALRQTVSWQRENLLEQPVDYAAEDAVIAELGLA